MPMVWQTDKRRLQGGYMRCVFKYVSFRLDHPEYRDKEVTRKRTSYRAMVIEQMDTKINEMLDSYPFLKEVLSAV
jgi:hypothetical protein